MLPGNAAARAEQRGPGLPQSTDVDAIGGGREVHVLQDGIDGIAEGQRGQLRRGDGGLSAAGRRVEPLPRRCGGIERGRRQGQFQINVAGRADGDVRADVPPDPVALRAERVAAGSQAQELKDAVFIAQGFLRGDPFFLIDEDDRGPDDRGAPAVDDATPDFSVSAGRGRDGAENQDGQSAEGAAKWAAHVGKRLLP